MPLNKPKWVDYARDARSEVVQKSEIARRRAAPTVRRKMSRPMRHLFVSVLAVSRSLFVKGEETATKYAWNQDSAPETAGLGSAKKYGEYVAAQSKKFARGLNTTAPLDWDAEWKDYEARALAHFGGVSRDSMQQVADFLKQNIRLVNKFGLCHGSNRGFEVAYLREMLPGVEVWGTDLTPAFQNLSNWTINWDFHVVKPEWRGRTDFVYSNALDHSPKPTLAVQRWMETVSPGGAVIIEWSKFHERRVHSKTDPFGASFTQLHHILVGEGKRNGFQVTTFNSSATHSKKSYAYRLWSVLRHLPASGAA